MAMRIPVTFSAKEKVLYEHVQKIREGARAAYIKDLIQADMEKKKSPEKSSDFVNF
jgi:hypothetical protein